MYLDRLRQYDLPLPDRHARHCRQHELYFLQNHIFTPQCGPQVDIRCGVCDCWSGFVCVYLVVGGGQEVLYAPRKKEGTLMVDIGPRDYTHTQPTESQQVLK